MTPRQKTIGITAAVVVSVLTFTTYNPIGDRFLSTSSTGQNFQPTSVLKKQTEVNKDTLLYQKKPVDKYASGYNNPMED